jgi:hypothetical protein
MHLVCDTVRLLVLWEQWQNYNNLQWNTDSATLPKYFSFKVYEECHKNVSNRNSILLVSSKMYEMGVNWLTLFPFMV